MGKLLIGHFHGTIANDDAKTLIKEIGVGGIIYFNFSNDLSSPEKVFSLSHSLQAIASIPLLIAIDQEGGRVARLSQGFTKIPANQALGETNKLCLSFSYRTRIKSF